MTNIKEIQAMAHRHCTAVQEREARKAAEICAMQEQREGTIEVIRIFLAGTYDVFPAPAKVFSGLFKSVCELLEYRGLRLAERDMLTNDAGGFNCLLSLVDSSSPEHTATVEAMTDVIMDGRVAVVHYAPRKDSEPINYALPKGAEDLTATVLENAVSKKGGR